MCIRDSPLPPLHNPANLAGIRAARRALPGVPHVAVFDTAFHARMPRRASTYAIDQEVALQNGIRRFGFHGTSHASVSYTHLRAHETVLDLVCRLLLEKKKTHATIKYLRDVV